MPKPLPVIYLPRMADQQTLIRALYEIGYQYGPRASVHEALTDWAVWAGSNHELSNFPYVSLKSMARKRVSSYPARPANRTLVNSIKHFIAYTRSLPPPPALPPAQTLVEELIASFDENA